MPEYNLLYQLKTLENLIMRIVICDTTDCHQVISPTPTQMQIVAYILKHQNENIYQKDLEKVLHLRRATVSGVLQTMEKNHLIERVIDTDDSRVKRIILHQDAKKIFNDHMKKIIEIENVIVKGISNEDLRKFLQVLEKMQNNLKEVTEKERNVKC